MNARGGLVVVALACLVLTARPADARLAPDSATSIAPAAGTQGVSAPASRDYLAEARAAYTPVNRTYQGIRVTLELMGPLYAILAAALLLFTGLSARFRDIAHGLGHTLYVRVLVYLALYATATTLLSLPLEWYRGFALEHQFGLSTQSFGGWALDMLKGMVFAIVSLGVVPLLALAWRVIQRHPRGWWWRLAAGAVPLAIAVTLLEPVVFEPLFNRFTPLRDATLRGEILSLAARADIPARHVYEVDMSRRTRKLNAYVSGFGASQRIVLWDTTLERLDRDEILVVMGHEMGHYVLRHIWVLIAMAGVGAFIVCFVAARIAGALLAAFGERWGATGVGDLAALPALAIALVIVVNLLDPLAGAVSRRIEHQSDVYALELTHANDAAARAFLKLAQDNRSDPEPPAWIRLLLYEHPPLAERIRFALEYRPWEQGRPNRYFRPSHRAGVVSVRDAAPAAPALR